MPEQTVILACLALLLIQRMRRNREKRRERLHRRKLRERRIMASTNAALLNIKQISREHQKIKHMTSSNLEHLLNLIGPKLSTAETTSKKCLPMKDRLTVTLRFLTSGDSLIKLQRAFKIPKQSLCHIVLEVCEALSEVLKPYMKSPKNLEDWLEISRAFERKWDLPHCVGALDGRRVILQASTPVSGDSYDSTSHFSLVLYAIVDADYNFLLVDIGHQNGVLDYEVFRSTELYKNIQTKNLELPSSKPLPYRQITVPYFLAGTEAFNCSENLIRPYSVADGEDCGQTIFNYRLRKARRPVENAFGSLSSVFQILNKPMPLELQQATSVLKAIVHLHNYLRLESRSIYTPHGLLDYQLDGNIVEGTWRNNANTSSFLRLNNIDILDSLACNEIRHEIADYCANEGKIPDQDISV